MLHLPCRGKQKEPFLFVVKYYFEGSCIFNIVMCEKTVKAETGLLLFVTESTSVQLIVSLSRLIINENLKCILIVSE